MTIQNIEKENKKIIPSMVRNIAIVLLVSAIFLVIYGVSTSLVNLFGRNIFFGFGGGGPNIFFLITSLLQITLGISGIILARGLFKAKPWARKYTILLVGITTFAYILMLILSFFVGPIPATSNSADYFLLLGTLNFIFLIGSFASGIFSLILAFAVSIFFIYSIFYLYSNKEVKEAFQ